jgi:hypothetical protein
LPANKITGTSLRLTRSNKARRPAARLHPRFDGVPVVEMSKTVIDPRTAGFEKAVRAKSSAKFMVAFDELTSGCNSCHAGADKPLYSDTNTSIA